MENERALKRLTVENDLLKEEVSCLRDMILEMKFKSVKWMFENNTEEQLTDISSKGAFPLTYEFLLDTGIELQVAMEWIRRKKKEVDEELKKEFENETERVKIHATGFVHR